MNCISPKWKSILLGLSHALVQLPKDLDQQQIEKRFLQRTNRLLIVMPVIQRCFLRMANLLFDLLPFFFGFGPTFFTELPLVKKQKYFDAWLYNRFLLFRDLAKAIRGLVLVVYFSDEEIWQHIDYHPKEHIRERIVLRQKLLNEQSK